METWSLSLLWWCCAVNSTSAVQNVTPMACVMSNVLWQSYFTGTSYSFDLAWSTWSHYAVDLRQIQDSNYSLSLSKEIVRSHSVSNQYFEDCSSERASPCITEHKPFWAPGKGTLPVLFNIKLLCPRHPIFILFKLTGPGTSAEKTKITQYCLMPIHMVWHMKKLWFCMLNTACSWGLSFLLTSDTTFQSDS